MQSDERMTAALTALRPQVSLFRFAVSGTIERAHNILAAESESASSRRSTLGEFAGGLIDADRFAMVSTGAEPLDTVGRAVIGRAIDDSGVSHACGRSRNSWSMFLPTFRRPPQFEHGLQHSDPHSALQYNRRARSASRVRSGSARTSFRGTSVREVDDKRAHARTTSHRARRRTGYRSVGVCAFPRWVHATRASGE